MACGDGEDAGQTLAPQGLLPADCLWDPVLSGPSYRSRFRVRPSNRDDVWVWNDAGLFHSANRGRDWDKVLPEPPVSIQLPGESAALVSLRDRVLRSIDGGLSWTEVALETFVEHRWFALEYGGKGPVYAWDAANLWRSDDDGETWSERLGPGALSAATPLDEVAVHGDRVVLQIDQPGSMSDLYVSNDKGASWSPGEFPRADFLTVGPGGRIAGSCWCGGFIDTAGLYVTYDDGKTFGLVPGRLMPITFNGWDERLWFTVSWFLETGEPGDVPSRGFELWWTDDWGLSLSGAVPEAGPISGARTAAIESAVLDPSDVEPQALPDFEQVVVGIPMLLEDGTSRGLLCYLGGDAESRLETEPPEQREALQSGQTVIYAYTGQDALPHLRAAVGFDGTVYTNETFAQVSTGRGTPAWYTAPDHMQEVVDIAVKTNHNVAILTREYSQEHDDGPTGAGVWKPDGEPASGEHVKIEPGTVATGLGVRHNGSLAIFTTGNVTTADRFEDNELEVWANTYIRRRTPLTPNAPPHYADCSDESPTSDCVRIPEGVVFSSLAVSEDRHLYALEPARGALWRRPLDADDHVWRLVAVGFRDPSKVFVDPRPGDGRIYVIDGHVYAMLPGDGMLLRPTRPEGPAQTGCDAGCPLGTCGASGVCELNAAP